MPMNKHKRATLTFTRDEVPAVLPIEEVVRIILVRGGKEDDAKLRTQFADLVAALVNRTGVLIRHEWEQMEWGFPDSIACVDFNAWKGYLPTVQVVFYGGDIATLGYGDLNDVIPLTMPPDGVIPIALPQ